ncbi:MAG TPA: MFS transporter [Rhizomicrobium sp.]|jgi:MFS family permease
MAYFRNSTVNLLNLHYAIHSIAMYGGGAFYAVYLLKAGLSLPAVLASFALIVGGRFVIRPVILPLAIRFGMRPLMIAGTLIAAIQYPLLALVHGVGPMLVLLCLTSSLGDVFYWPNYHAYFSTLGDQEHRGHQISMREALAAIVGIVAPIGTGWVLVTFGPLAAFGATAVVQALGAVPFFWTPDVAVARAAPGAWKAAIPGVKLFIADGWIAAGFVVVWQLTLFVSLGENFVAYGGALAAAAVVGAIAGLLLGRHIDAGHGGRAVVIACVVCAAILTLRAVSPGHVALAVFANALGALSNCLYAPVLMTAVYNQSKRAPCTLRFHIATEGGWDAGMATGCLIAALLTWMGTPLSTTLLLPLLGVGAIALMLRGYYARNPVAIDAPEVL